MSKAVVIYNAGLGGYRVQVIARGQVVYEVSGGNPPQRVGPPVSERKVLRWVEQFTAGAVQGLRDSGIEVIAGQDLELEV